MVLEDFKELRTDKLWLNTGLDLRGSVPLGYYGSVYPPEQARQVVAALKELYKAGELECATTRDTGGVERMHFRSPDMDLRLSYRKKREQTRHENA